VTNALGGVREMDVALLLLHQEQRHIHLAHAAQRVGHAPQVTPGRSREAAGADFEHRERFAQPARRDARAVHAAHVAAACARQFFGQHAESPPERARQTGVNRRGSMSHRSALGRHRT
jgi:hypothetical protein